MLSNESREALLRFVESAIKKKEPTKEAKFDEKDDEEINAAVVEAFKSGVFTGLEEKSSMHVVKSIVRYLGGELAFRRRKPLGSNRRLYETFRDAQALKA
jgi:hypothetical protein